MTRNPRLHSTLLLRMSLLFLALLLPLTLAGGALYNIGARNASEDGLKIAGAQSKHASETFFRDVTRIRAITGEFVFDAQLFDILRGTSAFDRRSESAYLYGLAKRVETLSSVGNFSDTISLYLPARDNEIRIGPYLSINAIDQANLARVREQAAGSVSVFSERDGALYFVIPGDLEMTPESPDYYLEVRMDQAKLADALCAGLDYGGRLILLSDDHRQRFLFGEPDGARALSISPDELASHDDVRLEGVDYRVFCVSDASLGASLFTLVPTSQLYANMRPLIAVFYVFVALCLAVMAVFFAQGNRMLGRPLRRFSNAFAEVRRGNLGVRIEPTGNPELDQLFDSFHEMVDSLRELIGENTMQHLLIKDAQMKQLQAQINPHFLYNSFFVLSRMIQAEDDESAISLLDHLGNYFRHITRSGPDRVPLIEEFQHMSEYLAIQQIRFGDRVRCQIDPLPGDMAALSVPRLILQPVVENYFHYGFERDAKPGTLRIGLKRANGRVSVVFEDDLCRLADAEALNQRLVDTGADAAMLSGLSNISARIRLMYGPDSGVTLTPLPPAGVRTEVSFREEEGDAV